MTWLCRALPKSLSPRRERIACAAGIIFGPREPRLFEQPLQGDLSQIRDKQVEPSELGSESPGRKIQPVHIGNLCDLGPRPWKSFLVSSSGQPGKTFFFENQRDSNGDLPSARSLPGPG